MAFVRSGLIPGDFANVSFLQGWVEIAEVLGPDHYVGIPIDHQASMGAQIKGYPVRFSSQDIVSSIKRRSSHLGGGIFEAFRAPVETPIFEAFRERPSTPLFEIPEEEAPRRHFTRPERGVVPSRPEARSPVRQEAVRRPEPSKVDPSRWFDLRSLWRRIRTERLHPEFIKAAEAYPRTKVYADIPLVLISRKGPDQQARIADFFGVPPKEYDRMVREGTWDRAIGSMLEEIEKSLNEATEEFDGFVEFGFDSADNFGLNYFEGGD